MTEKIHVYFNPFKLDGDLDQVATKFEIVFPEIEIFVPLNDTIWDLASLDAKTKIPLSIEYSFKDPISVSKIICNLSDMEDAFIEFVSATRSGYESSIAKLPVALREKLGLHAVKNWLGL